MVLQTSRSNSSWASFSAALEVLLSQDVEVAGPANRILDVDDVSVDDWVDGDTSEAEINDKILREVHDWLEASQWDGHWSLRKHRLCTVS